MPDIDPAALSRSATIPQPSSTPTTASKTIPAGSANAPASVKTGKPAAGVQRIDLEPLYTSLKAAVGDHWVEYKEAISSFVLGHLNQAELSTRIDHFITSDPATQHLHNQLITAVYGNVTRDLPEHGVASWVSANDKPTNVSKPAAGDAAEQRLKTEVMQLPARDRRRLKAIADAEPVDALSNSLYDYHQVKQVKIPDTVPASAGGLNKTNWDLEIHKRYHQPLAAETFEFPEPSTIGLRMTPICYEEGLPAGASTPTECANYLSVATETFVKEVLSTIFGRTRSNGPSYVSTEKYKRQLEREEDGWLRGDVKRDLNGLLPVEQEGVRGGGVLGMGDFRLAVEMGVGGGLGMMPLLVDRIMGGYLEGEGEAENEGFDGDDDRDGGNAGNGLLLEGSGGLDLDVGVNGGFFSANGNANGSREDNEMDPLNGGDYGDYGDYGWQGAGAADRDILGSLLDDCLVGTSAEAQ
ncbi:MAG: hypothetical protein M1819_000982 [Sarea resinae]|nr:MAG: hypothetical protein M1819_000982 [Sarea resinae]